MEWNLKERKRRKRQQAIAGLSLLIAMLSFVFTFSKLSAEYDVGQQLSELKNSGLGLPLENWKVGFFRCPEGRKDLVGCQLLKEEASLGFPLGDLQVTRLSEVLKDTSHVRASYTLDSEAKAFFEKQATDQSPVALVLVRSVQNQLILQADQKISVTPGVGSNGVLYLDPEDLLRIPELQMVFEMRTLPWFGPSVIPPQIVRADQVPRLSETATRLQFGSDVQSQLEVGFPLVFAAVAMVLDESPTYTLASVYGTFRALKAAFAFALSHSSGEVHPSLFYAYSGLNSLCLFLLVALVVSLTVPELIGRKVALGFALSMLAVGVLAQQIWTDFYLRADIYADALGCGISLAFVGFFLSKRVQSRGESFSRDISKSALLIAGLGVHGFVNLQEILGESHSVLLKNSLDWKHGVLFPALLAASLVNLGSIERKMTTFAKKFAETKVIDHELKLAKEMQKRLLPARKKQKGEFEWRLLSLPATSLAGDWADVAIVKGDSGKCYLVGCLIDVTGHGIGAALATGTLCSQWNLWRKKLEAAHTDLDDAKEREVCLATIAESMSESLVALGREDSCTAAFFVWSPGAREITYLTCGHPGMLVYAAGSKDCRYLRTSFSGLGVAFQMGQNELWKAETIGIEGEQTLAVYSDGLIPTEKTFTKWIKEIRTAHSLNPKGTSAMMGRQLRKNRTEFRTNSAHTDDITLLFVLLKGAERQDQGEAA